MHQRFQLAKNNISTAIKDRILAEKQTHAIVGSNPLSVANRLNKLLGDQNSSWERLACTEMADTAETAKSNEWKACGLKKVDFVPAPDACPIRKALTGTYSLGEYPKITVHPRCRCTKQPTINSQRNVNFFCNRLKNHAKVIKDILLNIFKICFKTLEGD